MALDLGQPIKKVACSFCWMLGVVVDVASQITPTWPFGHLACQSAPPPSISGMSVNAMWSTHRAAYIWILSLGVKLDDNVETNRENG